MLDAAPHRGAQRKTLARAGCAVGVGFHASAADASVAERGERLVAFTGSLDNRRSLAARLGLASPEDALPAEVVLAGFDAWGSAVAGHLRGVYAVVVAEGGRLWCFRDHLGFAPLFYRRDGEGAYAATEAKQVVAGAALARAPDLDVVERIFYRADDDRMPSALAGVERLPKGTVLDLSAGRAHTTRYWEPAGLLETARLTPDALRARFDELMAQAVDRSLAGDDVVSLSGGVDSPAVAAYAAPSHLKASGRPLPALSAVFPGLPSVDERRYVERVAAELGLELHTYEQRASAMDRLDEWAALVDGPVPTISLTHYEEHYRRARELGARTVLSGELAELVFDVRNWLVQHLLTSGRVRALVNELRAERETGRGMRAIGREVLRTFVPTRVTAARLREDPRGVPPWVDLRRANEAAAASLVPVRRRWRHMQLAAATMGSGITAEAESICQEVCGVRARRPWVDIDLFELFLSLPAEVKFPDNRHKTLVRGLLRGRVPDVVLDRRDKTFFDDSIMSRIDYPELRRWLASPDHRIAGVDYRMLGERLEHEDLDLAGFMWAKDLASAHAFLSQW